MRLIDADAYKAEMKQRQDACAEWRDEAKACCDTELYVRADGALATFVEAKVTLDKMPTVDAVPVVRCRECVHRDKRYEWHGDYNCRLHHEPKSLDFFCSDGERKSDLSLGTDNRCVCCGEIVPEGAQVCPTCIREAET